MKSITPNRVGIALIFGVAMTAIVSTHVAFAQDHDGQDASGFSALIGRETIRANDKRFQPAAAAMMHEATQASMMGIKARIIFDRTLISDHIDHTLIVLDSRSARGTTMRPLTASEAAVLEQLFSSDLSKARRAEIDANGFTGSVSSKDLGTNSKELLAKARAAAKQRSQWYDQASKELDKMKPGSQPQ